MSQVSPIARAIRALESRVQSRPLGQVHLMTDGERIITIPRANPVNAYKMGGIIKDAGLTVEDFRELL